MSASRARLAALKAVSRVRERSAYAHETLDAVLRTEGLDERDRAFATRIAYGTIACRGTLDEAVSRYLRPGGSLEPLVADALAVSAYELLFASTPARAAVNEGVELVRAVQPKASGLANAVLRKLAADVPSFPWGDASVSDQALARRYGHPTWLATMWVDELGREAAEQVMAANNEPAPLFLAHLPFASSREDVVGRLADAGAHPAHCPLPGCIQAGSAAAAVRADVLKSHDVIVMDAGAQLASSLVPLHDGATVVELGAGRGSKTLWLAGNAAAMGLNTDIVAVDLHRFKLDILDATVAELGLSNVVTVATDATSVTPEALGLDTAVSAVLVDAPCSGLGTLRRHPDRRWRATPSELSDLADLGARLLRSAASLVAPNGFVVYSTCTVARAENQDVVQRFLASADGHGFSVERLDERVPEAWRQYVTAEGYFQSLPAVGGMDGHFVAVLHRG